MNSVSSMSANSAFLIADKLKSAPLRLGRSENFNERTGYVGLLPLFLASLALTGWRSNRTARFFLGLLLLSDSSANASSWSHAEYDALVEAAAATSDETEQAELYAAAQAIVRDEAPLIPLAYGHSWWLARESLRGDALSGTGILRYADLEWAG